MTIAILSDLDGTLIDSKASIVRAFARWAELRELPPGITERIPHGRTSTAAAAELAPHLDAEHEGAWLDAQQCADTDGVVALPGAHALLSSSGPLAIVTSCPLPLARARLRAAGLPEPGTLITPELTTRGKPDPAPYLLAAQRLHVAPAECIVLEDAPAGVAAGVAAGMTVVALGTTHDRADLPGAHAYIRDLTELPGARERLALVD